MLDLTRPSEIARRHYEAEGQPAGLSWEELLSLYNGFNYRVLVDTESTFLLAKPVRWDDAEGIAIDKAFRPEDCDTWFVWMFVGDLCDISPLVPFELAYVAWRSIDDVLHFYQFPRLKKILDSLYHEVRSQHPRST
jgi:hypothetical protein